MSAPDRTDLWLPTAVASDQYVGPYRIIRKAGSGGMGVVYLAVDKDERPVAVKVLRDHIADDADARARLRRELITMRRVRDRYIADVVDADLEAERPYIVSEFVHGPQLDDYVGDVGPLDRDGLITLGRGLLGALDAIHAVGVVHRDLKPGNVLLEGHRPVVIDFGIAQLADETRLTMSGLFVGTPGYVSPETIAGEAATPATDWWSWAAVLAYAATGTSPAGKGPVEVVLDRIRRGDLRLDAVDADLRPLLQDCLAIDPAARPASAEIRARFERYAEGGSTGPARVPRPQPAPAAPSAAPTEGPAPTLAERPAQKAPESAQIPGRAAPPIRVDSGPRAAAPAAAPPGPDAQPDPVDAPPPPPRPRPTPAILAGAALLTTAAMSMPVATGLLLVVLLTFARSVDVFLTRVQWRLQTGESARRARILQSLATPWDAVKAFVVSVGTMLLPGALAVGVSYVASRVLPDFLGATSHVGNLSAGLGAVAGLLMLWYGPGSRTTTSSVRRCLRSFLPSRQSLSALTIILLVAAAAVALVVYRYPVLDWFPLPWNPTSGLWR